MIIYTPFIDVPRLSLQYSHEYQCMMFQWKFHIKFRFISPYQWMYIYIFHIIFMGISYPISRLSHINVPMKSPWNIRVSSAWLWAAAPHEANAECPVAELDESLGFKLQDLTKKEWFHHEKMWVNMIQTMKHGGSNHHKWCFNFNHEKWWLHDTRIFHIMSICRWW